MSGQLPVRAAANVLAAPTLWGAHFLAVYASESLLCRVGSPGGHDAIVVSATGAALFAVLWHGWRMRPGTGPRDLAGQLKSIAFGLTALGAVAIALVGVSALALPACT